MLVRSGLDAASSDPVTPTTPTTTSVETRPAQTEPVRTTTTASSRFYRVESGDTLESIAAAHDTSVEALLQLNPKVDPVALTVGQRIRVG